MEPQKEILREIYVETSFGNLNLFQIYEGINSNRYDLVKITFTCGLCKKTFTQDKLGGEISKLPPENQPAILCETCVMEFG